MVSSNGFCEHDLEFFESLFVLLYADDTATLSGTGNDMQALINEE